ncbi:hypothetical protein CONLIGDRAFT_703800 [Coniochaeta ligniaria NRRL 30616]|uniref:Uncharacterized protein n=1 Tax=Coniochaeta ligniaria NRRL 30616 TaxID=1408157 RepID=A0A1J7IMK3_9PEZI|nr:hypothetical protein CONLIGDRAFT_703800 [Coniochaeta ligniaria NRRL 30616]
MVTTVPRKRFHRSLKQDRVSPYWIDGIWSEEEIGDPAIRQCLQSQEPFARTRSLRLSMVIRTNIIVLFRTLIFFGHFWNCGEIYWETVSDVLGWKVIVCKAITRYYTRTRAEYVRRQILTPLPNDNSESVQTAQTICSLVDEYIELTAKAPHLGGRSSRARDDYIKATRAEWTKILAQRSHELSDHRLFFNAPQLPRDADWLSDTEGSRRRGVSRDRSRSPRGSTRQPHRTRSPLRSSTLSTRRSPVLKIKSTPRPDSELRMADPAPETVVVKKEKSPTPDTGLISVNPVPFVGNVHATEQVPERGKYHSHFGYKIACRLMATYETTTDKHQPAEDVSTIMSKATAELEKVVYAPETAPATREIYIRALVHLRIAVETVREAKGGK